MVTIRIFVSCSRLVVGHWKLYFNLGSNVARFTNGELQSIAGGSILGPVNVETAGIEDLKRSRVNTKCPI